MKAEHRHELKTNELAEWLANLPQWTLDNLTTIILAVVLIVVITGFFMWRGYNRDVVQSRERVEFTNLLNQLAGSKTQIVRAQTEGKDLAFMLLQPAKGLDTFARNTKNNRMAALAFIKRAEAIRAELHYGNVEKQYVIEQTNEAKASYNEALKRCVGNNSLTAAAKFGLGLCEEELGNFEQAREIYKEVAESSDYEGTGPAAQAQWRLKIMSDYEKEIAFNPNPNPQPTETELQTLQTQPDAFNVPLDLGLPLELDLPEESNQPPATGVPADSNQTVEANLPVEN